MTRKEFMTSLRQYLAPLPLSDDERADILSDYEEHFRVGLENGKSEAEIAASLGSPYDVASQYVADSKPVSASSQSRSYNQGYSQAQQPYVQQNAYRSTYAQSGQNDYNAQQEGYNRTYAQGGTQPNQGNYNAQYDGYVYENQNTQTYQDNTNHDKTAGLVLVIVLCVLLIPTVGFAIVSLLLGLYGSVIGFGVAGAALVSGGAALFISNLWLGLGLIFLGFSFFALTALLVIASIEATKLVIKLVKWCIKECKKMITEGVF